MRVDGGAAGGGAGREVGTDHSSVLGRMAAGEEGKAAKAPQDQIVAVIGRKQPLH